MHAEFILLLLLQGVTPSFTSFTRKIIAQSSPVVNALNTITVSLISDVSLSGNMVITITGLSAGIANSPLPLSSVSAGNQGDVLFSVGSVAKAASFTNGQVQLTISADKVLNASAAYAFAFVINNPATVPATPSISIVCNSIAEAMDTPNAPLLGVINGRNPLVIPVRIKIIRPKWV